MSEKIEANLISRRAVFSFLGLAPAVALVMPTMGLMTSEADAQTPGMERRHERREHRHERRRIVQHGGQ